MSTRTVATRGLVLLAAAVALLAGCDAEDEPLPGDGRPGEAADADRGDGVLLLGALLPETGPLQFLGRSMTAGTEMAVSDINAAGGVLGAPVELLTADEAGEATVARRAVEDLLDAGVDAVVGAAASAMSRAVADALADEGVVQCSPASTSPDLTGDEGGFFRTAATDVLQGPVLARMIAGDGHRRVAVLARDDAYGQGLSEAMADAFDERGGEVVERVLYDTDAVRFDEEVARVSEANPDAVVVLGFTESAQVLRALIEQDLGPSDFPIYGGESLRASDLAERVDPNDPGALDGLRGTAPTSDADEAFLERLEEFRPAAGTLFAAESYDCVVLVALAAVAAGSDDPTVFADHVVPLTRGGAACRGFERCAGLLAEGEAIAYRGASGLDGLTDDGQPTRGLYEVWELVDGEYETIDEVESRLR